MPEIEELLQAYPALDLLIPSLDLEHRNDGLWIRDNIRKVWLKLTPEEWVRQHAIFWLIHKTGFSEGLLSIERAFSPKSLKRADIVGFGTQGKPILLVECKEPFTDIDEETARQALQYNQYIKAKYIWLTNGKSHKVLTFSQTGEYIQLSSLPDYQTMANE
jgi:hypothetical protein